MTVNAPPPSASERIVAIDGPLTIKNHPAARSNYLYRAAPRPIRFIVLHSTEGHEGFKQDDNVAAMFARADLKPRRSCHYIVDSDSVTQCVPDASIAWHCGRTGNARGLGIELCGKARQTHEEWLDELSLPMLCIAARLVANLCHAYKLPVRFVDGAALRTGGSGITTHAAVGAAWRETTHTDPGKSFPIDLFLQATQRAHASL